MKTNFVNLCRTSLVLAGCLISGLVFAQGDVGGTAVGGGGPQINLPQQGRGGGFGRGNVSSSTVTVAADEFNNALIISAPEETLTAIKELIAKLDRQVEENTTLEVFRLEHADPQDMVSQIQTLFPDPTTLNRGGGGGRGNTRVASFTTPDGRVIRQARVLAVADLRTSSVIVSASAAMIAEVGRIIRELDSDPSSQVQVYTIPVEDLDPTIAVQVLQSVIPSRNGIRSTTGFGTGTFGRGTTTGRSTTGIGGFGTGGTTGRGVGGTTGIGGTRTTGGTFGR